MSTRLLWSDYPSMRAATNVCSHTGHFREKLHEAHSDLQKKREVIDDLEPKVDGNSKILQIHFQPPPLALCSLLKKKFMLLPLSGQENRWTPGDPEEEGRGHEADGGAIQTLRGEGEDGQLRQSLFTHHKKIPIFHPLDFYNLAKTNFWLYSERWKPAYIFVTCRSVK